jgi:hypothetical membrane protein
VIIMPGQRAAATAQRSPASLDDLSTDKWQRLGYWAVIPAAAAAGVYLLGAAVAYRSFPHEFSPWNNNWLSDLGNRVLNPAGAWAYRLGCFLAGGLMIALYVSLTAWHRTAPRRQKVLVAASQLLGGTAAIALVMTAAYPEDMFRPHQFWSQILFSAFAGLMFVSAFTFRSPGQPKAPIILTAFVGYLAITASLLVPTAHWLEWAAVADVLIFTCLLGARTSTLCRGRRHARPLES